MSSRCTFLLNWFGDRFILLKEEWLNTVIDFLEQKVPRSKGFSNEQFANLVFDQWAQSDFASTSFPVFGNHGIDPTVKKQVLKGPIVCQVNSFMDVGSPFYAQLCSLKAGSSQKTDNTGFDTIFHEKTDDFDQKPSRLLKLSLTDGENALGAIEFWKCSELSLHFPPGTKLYILPPCLVRKGVFMLRPCNFQVLGGGVLPLLEEKIPVGNYARILGIQKVEVVSSEDVSPEDVKEQIEVRNSSSISSYRPSANLTRYLNKPPPSTSARHTSPDPFDEDVPTQNQKPDVYTPKRKSLENTIPVSSILRQIQDEDVDDEELRISKRVRSPRKRKSTESGGTEKPNNIIRACGQLTSRRINPMDEILENMIEKGEEPVHFTPRNPFKTGAPAKKIKIEADSDDDIQIIEISPVPRKRKSEHSEHKEPEKHTREERDALEAFGKLKLSSFAESTKKMKYSIGSKRFWMMAIIEDIAEPLRVVDELWTMKVEMADESEGKREVFVDNATLERLIGYTCQEAIAIRKSSDLEKRKDGKRRLEALEKQLQRLDLIFEIEFFPGATSSTPVIRSMKTLAEQLDVY